MNCHTPLRKIKGAARRTLCALAAWVLLLTGAGAQGRVVELLSPASPQSTPPQVETARARISTTTREGRLAIFDEVWETVAARYYDARLRGLDWPQLRAKFRPLAAEARGAAEFYALLRRMLACLDDPHTRVYAPEENSDWSTPRYVAVGLAVRELAAGELTVVRVERGSEAARAGVRAGDALTRIDGEAASVVLARRLAEQAAAPGGPPSAAARLRAVSHVFEGPRDTTVAIVFRSSRDGRERSVSLRREVHTRVPELSARRVGGHFGLIRFNTFTAEVAAQFARALGTELRDVRGLVLDLRENGGGESEAMTDIASIFLGAGELLGKFTNRAGRVEIEPRTRAAMLSAADALPSTRVPLVVLTSAHTASASEIFVAALSERGRARLIGEATCGCVLAIRRRHTLADGGALDVSELDFHTARGTRLEGAGIVPDERVAPTRVELSEGRDRALGRAVEILKEIVK